MVDHAHHADCEHLAARPAQRIRRSSDRRGRYSSATEYIRELIRDDEKRKAERLEALLLEWLESEESELTGPDFDDMRKRWRSSNAAKRRADGDRLSEGQRQATWSKATCTLPSMPASRPPSGSCREPMRVSAISPAIREWEQPCPPLDPKLTGLRKWRVNGFEKFLVFYLPRPGGFRSCARCTPPKIGGAFFESCPKSNAA